MRPHKVPDAAFESPKPIRGPVLRRARLPEGRPAR